MPLVPYRPEMFPAHMGPRLQAAATVDCEWSDILRAAITVGRRNARAVFQHGMYSVFEANYRAYMVKANLTEDHNTRLVRTQAYKDLDPTEKGAVSYFLSMGLIKLLCEHFFSVPWLVHLDNFEGELDPPLARGSRPDLIGKDANDGWVVVEVKGRSNAMPNQLLADGKGQCTMVELVEGQPPAIRIVGGVYFGPDHSLQTVLRDPPPSERKRSELKIDRAKLLREYYEPLVEAVEKGDEKTTATYGNRLYRIARFPSLDFELGVDAQLEHAVHVEGDEGFVEQVSGAMRSVPSSIADPKAEEIKTGDRETVQLYRARSGIDADIPRSVSLGFDGTLIRLGPSWTAAGLLAPAE